MEFIIKNLSDLPNVSKSFLEHFGHHKVFAFVAEMGTGKTTFILSLLNAMGIENTEGSPTYALVNSYESNMYGKVLHMDLYRLDNQEDAFNLGLEEQLYGGVYCFIEWPEKIEKLLPLNTIWVYLRTNDDHSRILTIEYDH